jgi:hypothetical protein
MDGSEEARMLAQVSVIEALNKKGAPTSGIHVGVVISGDPARNVYLVRVNQEELICTAADTGGSRLGGHGGAPAYLAATNVLVFRVDPSAEVKLSGSSAGPDGVIICAFALTPKIEGPLHSMLSQNPATLADIDRNTLFQQIIRNEVEKSLNQDRSFKQLTDLVPGDWSKTTALGGLFLLSEFLTSMAVSPRCKIDMNGLLNSLEITSSTFLHDTEAYLRELYMKAGCPLDVQNFAFNDIEGLGGTISVPASFQKAADDEDIERVTPLEGDEQRGFFRRRLFTGGGVEGSYDTYRYDPNALRSTPYTFEEDVFPGLISETKNMSGVFRLQAAKEIKLQRTGSIVVPEQKAEALATDLTQESLDAFNEAEGEKQGITDTKLKSTEFSLTEDEVLKYAPLLHEEFADYDQAELFLKGLRMDGGVWYFPEKTDVQERVFGDTEPPTLPVLDADKQEYDLDDIEGLLSDAIEVYPGRPVKLFKNSSVFLMAEDGGIVIGDGFGGEIRMSRGTVTISSAADMKLLPGRDLISMVPGNSIHKAQDRIELSSTKGSVAIKADENLNMLSGNSGQGATVIENRGAGDPFTQVTADNLQAGDALKGGVIVKATGGGGVANLGSYLYGAGYPTGDGASESGVDPVDCPIVFDSGGAATLMKGLAGGFMYSTGFLGASRSTTGIYFDQSACTMVGSSIAGIVANEVAFDRGSGSISKPRLTRTGIQNITRSLPGISQIIMGANVKLDGLLEVKDNTILEKNLTVGGSISNADGAIAKNTQAVSVTVPDKSSALSVPCSLAVEGAGAALTTLVEDYAIATEYGIKISDFAFPDSDSTRYRAGNFELIAPKWHTLLEGGGTWRENLVEHSILSSGSKPYPGLQAYERDDTLITPEFDGSTVQKNETGLDDYPTNLREES